MKRREMLKLFGAAGLSVGTPCLNISSAQAAPPDHFWVMVNANGGWDPTIFCDPKDDRPRDDQRGPVTNVNFNESPPLRPASGGPIRFNAFNPDLDQNRLNGEAVYQRFLDRHANKTVVLNGVDAETNSHSIGSRTIWSGSSTEGTPSFAALVAGFYGPELPLAFLTNGGYDATAGLVAPARGSDQVETFNRLANPNQVWRNRLENNFYFPSSGTNDVYSMIRSATQERLDRLRERESLPLKRKQMEELYLARSAQINLTSLGDVVSELENENNIRQGRSVDFGDGGANNTAERLIEQSRLAVSAFASGLSVSVNLNVSGYDTHGNHDNSAYPRMAALLDGVNYLWEALEYMGLADRTTVVMGSDFGRTPYYNSGNGKDHWTITSMLVMGSNVQGNRVIGATDNHYRALPVDPVTLEQDSNGIIITSAHVHHALRRLAGVDSSPAASLFPMNVEELNLFSA